MVAGGAVVGAAVVGGTVVGATVVGAGVVGGCVAVPSGSGQASTTTSAAITARAVRRASTSQARARSRGGGGGAGAAAPGVVVAGRSVPAGSCGAVRLMSGTSSAFRPRNGGSGLPIPRPERDRGGGWGGELDERLPGPGCVDAGRAPVHEERHGQHLGHLARCGAGAGG